jgi:hypothetical protein
MNDNAWLVAKSKCFAGISGQFAGLAGNYAALDRLLNLRRNHEVYYRDKNRAHGCKKTTPEQEAYKLPAGNLASFLSLV